VSKRSPIQPHKPTHARPEGRAQRHAQPNRPRDSRPELKICGVNACLAASTRRPDDIRRIYLSEARLGVFREVLRDAARRRVAYHVVDDDELARITQSIHHEGVCMIVREQPAAQLGRVLDQVRAEIAADRPALVVYLERVGNPHNLGAILRVCAHFGALAVLACHEEGVQRSSALVRTAEGGAEWVSLVPVPTGFGPLARAKAAGLTLVATSPRASQTLYGPTPLPTHALVMLGSAGAGLSRALLDRADAVVQIPGTGRLESLNVACAASILLADHWRCHGARAPA
jgi:TrmH RNA methyltransferase